VQSVLIVDDDGLIRVGLSAAMERPGREIIVCEDIESAQLVIERQHVTCVVSDVRLTGPFRFEGLEFIREVKQRSPDTVVVLITGSASGELVREALARGAAAVLEKPFDIEDIESLIGEPETDEKPRVITMPSMDEILAGGALVPMFQPIVDLTSGESPHGFESLARYQTESILRFPDALFGYAARKERIVELELACITATFEQSAAVAATGARIFINIHPAVIGKGVLLSTLDRCVDSSGMPASRIVLEITEQQSLGRAEGVASECAALRSRGFTFALDDVGIAYSHLTHIDAIAPAYLKVSQEFGSSYELDPTRTRIVRNVLSLAREFGCELVLEGVETAATRDAARAEGIRLAQGYLFGRPSPPATYRPA
jgi:EAL domain-containing protein (putative c-di-GMP-specific phosphodiesterase class I)